MVMFNEYHSAYACLYMCISTYVCSIIVVVYCMVLLYVLYSPYSYSSNSAVLLLNCVSTLRWPVLKVYNNMHDSTYTIYMVHNFGFRPEPINYALKIANYTLSTAPKLSILCFNYAQRCPIMP